MSRLKHDVLSLDLPESVSLGLDSHDQEVYRDITPLGNLLIFLHQAHDEVGLLGHSYSVLWVVEPPVVGVVLLVGFLVLLALFKLHSVFERIRTTSKVANPLTVDGVLRVGRGEDLAQVELVELSAEVIVPHPPVAVVLESVVQLVLEPLVVVPSLVLVGKLARPLTCSPRVSDPDKLKPVHLSDLLNTVGVVEEDTSVAHAFLKVSIVVFDSVCASEEEALLVVFLEVFPELSTLNGLHSLRSSEVELLADSSSQVNQGLVHVSPVQHLVSSMKFGVGLLHQRNPKLLRITAVAIERSLAILVVWDPGVHNDVLPSSILEELEDSKAVLNSIIDHQVLEQLRVSTLDQEGAKEPAVSKGALLDVTWTHAVLEHAGISAAAADLLGSLPLNKWHLESVLWWVDWVIVQASFVGLELAVTKQSLILSADLDDLLDLLLDWILLWLLLLLVLQLLVTHVFLAVVCLLAVLSLLSDHLLVLLRRYRHTILSDELVGVVLAVHHLILLLLVKLLLVGLLLLRGQLAEVNLVHLHLHLHLLLILHLLKLLLSELHHWVAVLVNHLHAAWVLALHLPVLVVLASGAHVWVVLKLLVWGFVAFTWLLAVAPIMLVLVFIIVSIATCSIVSSIVARLLPWSSEHVVLLFLAVVPSQILLLVWLAWVCCDLTVSFCVHF